MTDFQKPITVCPTLSLSCPHLKNERPSQNRAFALNACASHAPEPAQEQSALAARWQTPKKKTPRRCGRLSVAIIAHNATYIHTNTHSLIVLSCRFDAHTKNSMLNVCLHFVQHTLDETNVMHTMHTQATYISYIILHSPSMYSAQHVCRYMYVLSVFGRLVWPLISRLC